MAEKLFMYKQRRGLDLNMFMCNGYSNCVYLALPDL